MSQGRDESGRYESDVSDDDVYRALRRFPDPVASATELAETLPVSAETVRRRLTALSERGRVDRKQVGARAVVWWVASRSDETDDVVADDPLFDLPTAASGHDDVSENVDDHLADGLSGG